MFSILVHWPKHNGEKWGGREEYAKGESFRIFVFIQLKVNKLSSLKEIN